MCEKSRCAHGAEALCSCKPVEDREKDVLALVEHLAVNMTDVRWDLDYTDLNRPEKRRMCRVGVCRVCGGRLCHEMDVSDDLAGDDFLAAVYRHLYQVHNAGGNHMANSEFRNRFVQMFHEQDRPFLREWLEQPGNSHVSRMYRRSVKPAPVEEPAEEVKIYTIVRTSADADRASFPPAMTAGSYLDLCFAREELRRLVEVEKENMDIPFDAELYREEYDDDFWEAYQEGYAAAWFTRLEILSSELKSSKIKKEGA